MFLLACLAANRTINVHGVLYPANLCPSVPEYTGNNPIATMETKLTLDREKSTKVVPGLHDTAHGAMFIGNYKLAVAIRGLRIIIIEVTKAMPTARTIPSFNQGTRLRCSASIRKNFGARMLKGLMMLSTCFSWITSGCHSALERGCSMLLYTTSRG